MVSTDYAASGATLALRVQREIADHKENGVRRVSGEIKER
jgi:hypothetical protein